MYHYNTLHSHILIQAMLYSIYSTYDCSPLFNQMYYIIVMHIYNRVLLQ